MDVQEMDDMEELPSMTMVYNAIATMNTDQSSPEQFQAASEMLVKLQKSSYGWRVAEDLISRKIDHYSCFFAAQTIQIKLQRGSNGLSREALISMRTAIYGYLSQLGVTKEDRVIATQLCIALARIILVLGAYRFATTDIVSRYKMLNTLYIIEELCILCDEIHTRCRYSAMNIYLELYTEFSQNLHVVIEFLEMVLRTEPNDDQLKKSAFKCFSSWINIDSVHASKVWPSAVLVEVLNLLHTNNCSLEVHDAAAETIMSFFNILTNDYNDQTELHTDVLNSIKKLESVYMVCVANDDTERSKNYARIFTDLATVLSHSAILSMMKSGYQPHFAIKSFDSVLLCANNDKYEVAQITFPAWSLLAEEVCAKNKAQLIDFFKHYFVQLTNVLYKFSVIDINKVNLLEEKDDDIAEIRARCSDLIKDMVFIVNPTDIFKEMYEKLQTGTSSDEAWNQKEAALFVMQAAARDLPPEENDVMPKVVEAITNMPDAVNINIRYTSVSLLGELGKWILYEPHNIYLEPVLNYLRYCLQQEDMAIVIAKSLHNICFTCRLPMVNYISGVIEMMNIVDNLNLSNDVTIGLLKGITVVISEMPEERRYEAVKGIFWRQFGPLLALVETNTPANTITNTPADPIFWLERILAIFRNFTVKEQHENNPSVMALVEMWPYMSNLYDIYKNNPQVTEYVSRCLKYMVQLVSRSTIALLKPVAQQITYLYNQHRHGSYLYIGSVLVEEYADAYDNEIMITESHSYLLEMIRAFYEPAFQLITQQGGLQNHPDFIVGFFRMASRFVAKLAETFLRSSEMESVVRLSLMTLTVDHKEANTTTIRFLVDLLTKGNPNRKEVIGVLVSKEGKDHMVTMFNAVGRRLVDNLIEMAVYTRNTSVVPDIMELIVEMVAYDRTKTLEWLNIAVINLPATNSAGNATANVEQRTRFLNSIYNNEHELFVNHKFRDFRQHFH